MRLIYLLIILLVANACDSEQRRLNKVKQEWIGKEILFPNTLQAKILGRDTVCNELLRKKHKVLMYVDSMGCSECKLQLYQWSQLIYANKNISDSLAFVLIVHAINPKIVSILCEQNKFVYPIFIDKKGEMFKMNRFPGHIELQTFLLNQDNQVLMVGNPVNNPAVWEKYLDII